MLRVRLLGHLDVTAAHEPLHASGVPSTPPLSACFLHRNEPQSRRHVAFTLWSDVSEAEALVRLRRRLHAFDECLQILSGEENVLSVAGSGCSRPRHPWSSSAPRCLESVGRWSDGWQVDSGPQSAISDQVGPHVFRM